MLGKSKTKLLLTGLGPGDGILSGLHMKALYSLTLQNQIIPPISVHMREGPGPSYLTRAQSHSLPPSLWPPRQTLSHCGIGVLNMNLGGMQAFSS